MADRERHARLASAQLQGGEERKHWQNEGGKLEIAIVERSELLCYLIEVFQCFGFWLINNRYDQLPGKRKL